MKSENFKAKFSRNALPVMVALLVMALILVTVPLTSTPAKVFGGYGWQNFMSDPTGIQSYKYASFVEDTDSGMDAGAANNEVTLATVGLNAAAIQGNDLDFSAFTLDGAPAASWSLSGDGDLVLNFKLDGLYAAGDVVILSGKYKDGTVFTVSVTVK